MNDQAGGGADPVSELDAEFEGLDSPDYRKSREPESDAGNARRFVIDHARDVRYVAPWKQWLIWEGSQYKPDDKNEIVNRAISTARGIFDEVKHVGKDADNQRRRAKHAITSQHYRAIRAMLDLASAQPEIAERPGAFDADPHLLGVSNGVLDLRTGQLLADDERRLITKSAAVPYSARAKCPIFKTAIEQIFAGRDDLIAYLQAAVGYSLTGLTSEQVIFLLTGGGSNGKTMLLELLFALLGDYAAKTSSESLLMSRLESSEIPNDVARLVGKRFVVCTELEAGRRLREARVKELTGGDTLTARFMRSEWFDFRPQFKVWWCGNHLPRIHGADHGIWRRIRLIEFAVTFAEKDQDRRLPEKLRHELPGILAWAVEGSKTWFRDGLPTSTRMREAGDHYRESEDVIGQFKAEKCIEAPNASVPLKELTAVYKAWAEAHGERQLSSRALGAWFEERGFRKVRGTGNAVEIEGLRVYG